MVSDRKGPCQRHASLNRLSDEDLEGWSVDYCRQILNRLFAREVEAIKAHSSDFGKTLWNGPAESSHLK